MSLQVIAAKSACKRVAAQWLADAADVADVAALKHVVGSCLVGSPGGHGGRELSAVVKMYPVTRIRDISRTVLKKRRLGFGV